MNEKNIKLQPVPPSMPLEALSARVSWINSVSNDIDRGTGCNFIFSLCRLLHCRPVLISVP